MRKSPKERLRMMRGFKARDTKPELVVRRVTHKLGYRFRLYRKDLPGKPDLVFPSRKKVIFIHGCFWHDHGCKLTRMPKLNRHYWFPKLKGNRLRDRRNVHVLAALGWQQLSVWECEISNHSLLKRRVKQFLG